MSGITFTGLSSGLDTASIVSALMSVARAPEQVLQVKTQTNQSQVNAYNALNSALTNLQTVVQGLNTSSSFNQVGATVADSTVLTATATGAAAAGSHTLSVTTLAASQRQVSTGYANGALFNTGTFTITDGAGKQTPVTITDSNNSLQGIAAAISNSGAKVTASILNDGSGTPNRLVINGNDTDNYTVDFSGLTTPPTAAGAPSQVPALLGSGDPSYQAGTPAAFTLDGIPMTSTSNTVASALPGVTLNLLKQGTPATVGPPATAAAPATTTFTLASSTSGITSNINSFVSAYNKVISLINSDTAYNSSTKTAGVLTGDSTMRMLQGQLQNLLTSSVAGSTPYSNMAQIGISSGDDGTLSVNSTTLSSALSSNLDSVVNLFTQNTGALKSLSKNQFGVMEQFNQAIASMVAPATLGGVLATSIQGLNNSTTSNNKQVSDMELRLVSYQKNLEAQFTAMETMVSNLKSEGSTLTSFFSSSSSTSSS